MPANDGWASRTGAFGTAYTVYNVTGGSSALPANIYTVTTLAQLKSALNAGGSSLSNVAKIIYVSGTITSFSKDGTTPNGPPDFAGAGPCSQWYATVSGTKYSESAYIGSATEFTTPSAAQTSALNSSETSFKASVTVPVGSNTTIVGLGTNAVIKDINLTISTNIINVILRNITFEDTSDCFPVWTDTDKNPVNPFYQAVDSSFPGNFNSCCDNVSMLGAHNWWVDHCHFTDAPDDDSTQPIYFNRPYQWHDGALDITSASDLGTVSWTIFEDHGKTNLIGGSDGAINASDAGHLRVTFHHNMWKNAEERQPRVRYGEVDLYNNFYNINNGPGYFGYVYSWGAGDYSHIYAEKNAFVTGGAASVFGPNQILYDYSNLLQAAVCILDARWNNPDATVDPVALANAAINSWPTTDVVSSTGITVAQTLAANNPPIVTNCTYWTPVARLAPPDNTQDVPALVLSGAVALPSVSPVSGFSGVAVGQSTSQTVTLNNTGAGILLINSVTATGDYSIGSNNCQGSLAANSSCQLSVVFTPSVLGPRTGTLSFSDWATGSPQQVSLSGAGIVLPTVSLTATAAVTGSHAGGYTMTITVKNTGTGPASNVVLSAASLGTTNGTGLPQTSGTIAAGGTGTFTVSVPGSAGLDGAGVAEKFSGTYTGGSYSASIRSVTLP